MTIRFVLALPLLASVAFAEDPRPRHAPPPEAYAACEAKAAADACQVTFRERTIDGTCTAAEDGKLFCRPERPPFGPRRPPPEALTACEGRAADDACQVALPDRTVDGTCAATPEGELFCRPAHPPPPPER